jgi:muramoyltetrapeptide carboxypeptidase LdcA involved in peptidoglycan recycling
MRDTLHSRHNGPMVPLTPPKLRPGSSVRVIAPSRSLAVISADVRAEADRRLTALGLKLSFGEHAEEADDFGSSSVEARLADLHDAFADPSVDGILSVVGGFSSNQLLAGIDYDLVAAHPKVLVGYSDITALSSALYARTGLVGYSGPTYSTFGMKHAFDYTLAGFQACVMADEPIDLKPAPGWSDDEWYLDQEKRRYETGTDWWVLQEGSASGTVVGGHLGTLNLLHGTAFKPSLDGTVLFVETDSPERPWDFDRDLVSRLQQPGFGGVRGLVIGRFQRGSAMTRELLTQIVASKPELAGLPVLANADFGHTSPMFTFPIGGTAELRADPAAPALRITIH